MLSFNSFDVIRDMWLGELARSDYRAFPAYGDFSNLGRISIFAGTNDVLTVFSKEMVEKSKQQSIDIDYTHRKDMFHCYPLFDMKESEEDNKKIMNLIQGK